MNDPRFNISLAIAQAVQFLRREWRYVFAAALAPFLIGLLTQLWLHFGSSSTSIAEALMSTLPHAAITGWFVYLLTRLTVFGERSYHFQADTDPAYQAERLRTQQACMLLWILLQMAKMGFGAYILYWASLASKGSAGIHGIIAMALIGCAFWALRLMCLPMLAAVGYSLRDFIFRVNGFMISARLLWLTMLVTFPFALFLKPITEALTNSEQPPDTPEAVALIFAISLLGTLQTIILTTACIFALREMLAPKRGKKA